MSTLPWKARTYIVVLAALALGAVLFSVLDTGNQMQWLAVLLLVTVVALLDAKPLMLFGEKIEISLSGSIKFAAILVYPAPVVILGTFVGTLLGELPAKRPWFKKLFNAAQMTVAYGATALVFRAIHQPQTTLFGSPQNFLALALAGATQFLVNWTLVSLIVSLASKIPLWSVWIQNTRQVGWYELTTPTLGTILAILWLYNPLSIILIGIPLLVIRHSYGVAVQLQRQTHDALRALMQVIDVRDHHTSEHSQRVSDHAQSIAKALGLPPEEIEVIAPAALLHDLGKVGMADDILFNPKLLSPAERKRAQAHAEVGGMLLSKFPLFDRGADFVKHHHERYDGKGYPGGLQGEAIPLGARIISVADSYQAMTEDRPYRRALTPEEAIAQLVEGRGTQFDPRVADAFIRALRSNSPEPAPTVVTPEPAQTD